MRPCHLLTPYERCFHELNEHVIRIIVKLQTSLPFRELSMAQALLYRTGDMQPQGNVQLSSEDEFQGAASIFLQC